MDEKITNDLNENIETGFLYTGDYKHQRFHYIASDVQKKRSSIYSLERFNTISFYKHRYREDFSTYTSRHRYNMNESRTKNGSFKKCPLIPNGTWVHIPINWMSSISHIFDVINDALKENDIESIYKLQQSEKDFYNEIVQSDTGRRLFQFDEKQNMNIFEYGVRDILMFGVNMLPPSQLSVHHHIHNKELSYSLMNKQEITKEKLSSPLPSTGHVMQLLVDIMYGLKDKSEENEIKCFINTCVPIHNIKVLLAAQSANQHEEEFINILKAKLTYGDSENSEETCNVIKFKRHHKTDDDYDDSKYSEFSRRFCDKPRKLVNRSDSNESDRVEDIDDEVVIFDDIPYQRAEILYSNPQPLFLDRFIKAKISLSKQESSKLIKSKFPDFFASLKNPDEIYLNKDMYLFQKMLQHDLISKFDSPINNQLGNQLGGYHFIKKYRNNLRQLSFIKDDTIMKNKAIYEQNRELLDLYSCIKDNCPEILYDYDNDIGITKSEYLINQFKLEAEKELQCVSEIQKSSMRPFRNDIRWKIFKETSRKQYKVFYKNVLVRHEREQKSKSFGRIRNIGRPNKSRKQFINLSCSNLKFCKFITLNKYQNLPCRIKSQNKYEVPKKDLHEELLNNDDLPCSIQVISSIQSTNSKLAPIKTMELREKKKMMERPFKTGSSYNFTNVNDNIKKEERHLIQARKKYAKELHKKDKLRLVEYETTKTCKCQPKENNLCLLGNIDYFHYSSKTISFLKSEDLTNSSNIGQINQIVTSTKNIPIHKVIETKDLEDFIYYDKIEINWRINSPYEVEHLEIIISKSNGERAERKYDINNNTTMAAETWWNYYFADLWKCGTVVEKDKMTIVLSKSEKKLNIRMNPTNVIIHKNPKVLIAGVFISCLIPFRSRPLMFEKSLKLKWTFSRNGFQPENNESTLQHRRTDLDLLSSCCCTNIMKGGIYKQFPANISRCITMRKLEEVRMKSKPFGSDSKEDIFHIKPQFSNYKDDPYDIQSRRILHTIGDGTFIPHNKIRFSNKLLFYRIAVSDMKTKENIRESFIEGEPSLIRNSIILTNMIDNLQEISHRNTQDKESEFHKIIQNENLIGSKLILLENHLETTYNSTNKYGGYGNIKNRSSKTLYKMNFNKRLFPTLDHKRGFTKFLHEQNYYSLRKLIWKPIIMPNPSLFPEVLSECLKFIEIIIDDKSVKLLYENNYHSSIRRVDLRASKNIQILHKSLLETQLMDSDFRFTLIARVISLLCEYSDSNENSTLKFHKPFKTNPSYNSSRKFQLILKKNHRNIMANYFEELVSIYIIQIINEDLKVLLRNIIPNKLIQMNPSQYDLSYRVNKSRLASTENDEPKFDYTNYLLCSKPLFKHLPTLWEENQEFIEVSKTEQNGLEIGSICLKKFKQEGLFKTIIESTSKLAENTANNSIIERQKSNKNTRLFHKHFKLIWKPISVYEVLVGCIYNGSAKDVKLGSSLESLNSFLLVELQMNSFNNVVLDLSRKIHQIILKTDLIKLMLQIDRRFPSGSTTILRNNMKYYFKNIEEMRKGCVKRINCEKRKRIAFKVSSNECNIVHGKNSSIKKYVKNKNPKSEIENQCLISDLLMIIDKDIGKHCGNKKENSESQRIGRKIITRKHTKLHNISNHYNILLESFKGESSKRYFLRNSNRQRLKRKTKDSNSVHDDDNKTKNNKRMKTLNTSLSSIENKLSKDSQRNNPLHEVHQQELIHFKADTNGKNKGLPKLIKDDHNIEHNTSRSIDEMKFN